MTDEQYESETPQDDTIIAKALIGSLVGLIVVGGLAGGAWFWLRDVDEPVDVEEKAVTLPQVRERPDVVVPSMPFTDITQESGIKFVHENGAYVKQDGKSDKLLPETMAGGCAFLDFDNDGDQDIFLTNAQRWSWDERGEETTTAALYANDGSGKFTDVTAGSGLDIGLYGNGVACGDYDNDGRVDIYISALGTNRLFHNEGDGQFKDVTEASGTGGGKDDWGTSCGFLDYDLDGDLDLFVCNYVVWTKKFDLDQNFNILGTTRAYGRPQDFPGAFPNLFRNDGNGDFTDVSADAGIQILNSASGKAMSKSLGTCFADFNADGYPDIFVANDTIQNQLFVNQKDGTFKEQGAASGVAFDINGNARGAMGTDIAYPRNSDAATIAIGNFANEMTAFYVSQPTSGGLLFNDEAVSNGIGPMTRIQLTFGLFFFDCDLDGRLDIFSANGHLEEEINKVMKSQQYEQPPQLLWNCGPEYATEFCAVEAENCGVEFSKRMVGRGASYADIDGDGDLDILIASTGREPRLLRNDQQTGHHFLRLKLRGSKSNRDAIGATVIVKGTNGLTLRKTVMPTCSYQSQIELPVTFGFGKSTEVESVTVRWPTGEEQPVQFELDSMLDVVEDNG